MKHTLKSAVTTTGRRMAGARSLWRANGMREDPFGRPVIGIAPEHQSRVFERFYRVDKSHSKASGGTGLGLSIVKHAVQYHHGDIRLTSKPGEGTVIRITFPAAAQ